MMLPGFVGGGYQVPHLAANTQRCVNLLVEIDQSGAKTPTSLVSVPGLLTVSTLGAGAVKALIEVNGTGYAAVGQSFGSFNAAGAFTALGTFSGTARVTLVSNGLQVLLIDGLSGFVYDIALRTWTQVTGPGFVYGATQATFQDGYGIVALPDSQQFGISGLYNFLAWDAIDFASAEGLPDHVATVVSNNRYLHVFGTSTLELWVNTGGSVASLFPFERVGGTFFQIGCSAPYSAVVADDSVFWLGNNAQGGLAVYRMQGQQPQRISTVAIEREIAEYGDVSDAFGIGLDVGRHPIYMLVFPTADKTWCYDAHSQTWIEWLEWADTDWQRTRINCAASVYGKLMAGDWRDGRIYKIAFNAYDNDGDPLRVLRMSPYVWNEGQRMFHSRMEVFLEAGAGASSPASEGYDPQVMMRFSDDGRRWSNESWVSAGRQGQFDSRAVWNRIGAARNRIYEISMTAPVKRAFMGASLAVNNGKARIGRPAGGSPGRGGGGGRGR